MLGRVIFCAVIAAAVLAVVLLATVSPLPRRDKASQGLSRAITVYIHPAQSAATARHQHQHRRQGGGAAHEDGQVATTAMVFRHRMTAGPEAASRTVGAASGFVLPGATMSVFDTVHLAFDAPGLSGSLCVEATRSKKGDREEVLRVVGGTGAFAFARGHAVLRAERGQRRMGNGGAGASSALRLELSVTSAAAG